MHEDKQKGSHAGKRNGQMTAIVNEMKRKLQLWRTSIKQYDPTKQCYILVWMINYVSIILYIIHKLSFAISFFFFFLNSVNGIITVSCTKWANAIFF